MIKIWNKNGKEMKICGKIADDEMKETIIGFKLIMGALSQETGEVITKFQFDVNNYVFTIEKKKETLE